MTTTFINLTRSRYFTEIEDSAAPYRWATSWRCFRGVSKPVRQRFIKNRARDLRDYNARMAESVDRSVRIVGGLI